MSIDAQRYLASFEALPAASQREVVALILRKAQFDETPTLSDEELAESAETVFLDYDRNEAADGS